jgi:hypothetical protein
MVSTISDLRELSVSSETTVIPISYQHLHGLSIYMRDKHIFLSVSMNDWLKPGNLSYRSAWDSPSILWDLSTTALSLVATGEIQTKLNSIRKPTFSKLSALLIKMFCVSGGATSCRFPPYRPEQRTRRLPDFDDFGFFIYRYTCYEEFS